MITLSIEPAELGDMPYVFSTWLRSYAESQYGRSLPAHAYYAAQHRTIERLLERGARVYVARGTEPGWLAGWVCCERGPAGHYVLHYAYVRGGAWRHNGIAKRLVRESAHALGADVLRGVYTHRRQPGASVLQRYGFEFRPTWRQHHD